MVTKGPKTQYITVRVTPMEHDAIKELALKDGRSVGDFVRRKLLRPIKVLNGEVAK